MPGRFGLRRLSPHGGVWEVTYKSGRGCLPSTSCVVEKVEKGWILRGHGTRVHKSRQMAARHHLDLMWSKVIAEKEVEIQAKWQQSSGLRIMEVSPEMAVSIYNVLVEMAMAPSGDKDAFVAQFRFGEWRFGGFLGSGGKFCANPGRWFVSAYREHLNLETLWVRNQVDEALHALFVKFALSETSQDAVW